MSVTMSENRQRPRWTSPFADIALRALLKLHFDYLAWSTPQDLECSDPEQEILCGPGLAYTDEVTSCAAITREFEAGRVDTQTLRIT